MLKSLLKIHIYRLLEGLTGIKSTLYSFPKYALTTVLEPLKSYEENVTELLFMYLRLDTRYTFSKNT